MTATFTTLDPLNQAHNPRHKLQSLILVEVFLAGGPCCIFRLWQEMFYGQKSINVGTLLFDREVMTMEKLGLLEETAQSKTAITKKGEIHLFGILLLGLIPKESLWRMEAKGLKLTSTQNILDESSVDGAHTCLVPLMSVATAEKNAGEQDSPTQSQDAAYRDTNQVPASQVRSAGFLDVAVTAGDYSSATKGQDADSGTSGEVVNSLSSSPLYLLASEIVDLVEEAEQERLEEIEAEREGVMTQMSGYPDAGVRGV
jgi:hypothetical protein